MTELPAEAERLFSVEPGEFVAERGATARALKEAGRTDEAAAVEAIRKPSAVVFAVNRAARARPQAARAAAKAAEQVAKAQLGGDPDGFARARGELDESLDLLAEVALAHVAPEGKSPSEAMRRRVRETLRAAVADERTREALSRGAVMEESEASGFSAFAGMTPTAAPRRKTRAAERKDTRKDRREERRRELQAELELAEKELAAAEEAAREAEQTRKRAERAVGSLRKRLERD
jgi:hypothetical protein